MPLPTSGTWPPQILLPVEEKFQAWSAWYAGDPELLADVYERLGQRNVRHPNIRPTQLRGGLVGTLARWFWGQPTAVGEKRTKLHVPLAGDIAATSANLLFSEPPTVSVENVKTQTRLDELIDDGIGSQMLEGAEVCSALGGVYLKVCWDQEISAAPWVTPMHADQAVPEWYYSKLRAVTFWRVIHSDASIVVRHLERHEMVGGFAAIMHGVYQGTATDLGKRVPLTDYPDTKVIAAAITTEGDTIQTAVPKLLATYVPNMRPNRLWRNLPAATWLGRADYAGVEPVMDALDETYSSLMRDLRLAKARLVVPDVYLQTRGPGRGALFDPDRELYESLNVLPGQQGLEISANQFKIRVDEHLRMCEEFAGKAISGAGYSLQTFGLSGEVAITATEVSAKERKSLTTRDQKIGYWKPALRDTYETLLLVDQLVLKTKDVVPSRPDVEFGDAVSEDPQSVAQTVALLAQAEAISTECKVRMVHPDWDDPKVEEEVGRIHDEKPGAGLTDPGAFTGSPGDQLPPAGPPPATNGDGPPSPADMATAAAASGRH